MSAPGGTCTPSRALQLPFSVLGSSASLIKGWSFLDYLAPALRFVPPDALSPLPAALPVRLCPRTPVHNTRQYEHPSPTVLGLLG